MEESNKEQKQKTKIYYNYGSFKGSVFEENVTSINSLLFGQGIKISYSPLLFIEMKKIKKIIYQ